MRYVGQAYGYGKIHVGFDEAEGAHTVQAQMVGPESAAEIALAGTATCKDGVLRARLGGGRDDESGIRVLGGGLIVLFAHDPMSTIVGFWDVRVTRDGRQDGPDGRLFRGMLEGVDPAEAAPDEGRQTGGQG